MARKRSVLQLLIILVLLALAPMYATGVFQTVPSGQIIWSQNSNPIGGYNYAEDVAVDTSGIYVVGSDQSPGNSEWRIEKRGLTNGSLISTFGSGGVVTSNPSDVGDRALGVAVDTSGIYIVGWGYALIDSMPLNPAWRIEKRSLTSGSSLWNRTNDPSTGTDEAHGIAVDSSGAYVVGYDHSPGNNEWRIEKRSLTDGSLITSFGTGGVITEDLSGGDDQPFGVAVDASGVYIVGYDQSLGNLEWRIEKRALTDGSLIWSQTENPSTESDYAYGIAVDGSGIYIVGYDTIPGDSKWRMEKRSLTDGSPIWSQTSNLSPGQDVAYDVAVDISGAYIVGYISSLGGGDQQWRIEKRDLNTGSLIWDQTENPSLQYDVAHGVAVDGSGVYIVGWDFIPGSYEWRMEKRNLGIPASKLVVTVSPSAVTAGSWTSKYTVQRQDQYGNPVTFGSTTVDLASTSTGTNKKFSETTGGTAVTSVTILDGSSTKDFYYYDDKAGSWSVSVSATGLTGDTKPLTVNPKTGCIIATATYESEMAPEVAYMRHVRDVMIGSSEVGRLLVSGWNAFYYSWSPPIAQFIESHDAVKPIFRVLLLPLVGIIHATALIYPVFASVNSAFGSVVAFLFASVISTVSYVMMPIFAARKILRIHSKV